MKVVINRCFGHFDLSDKAVELCIKYGMSCGDEKAKNVDFVNLNSGSYYAPHNRENRFRSHPIVVKVVEELREEANGQFAKLKIVEIPFNDISSWDIDENDGMEQVVGKYTSWS